MKDFYDLNTLQGIYDYLDIDYLKDCYAKGTVAHSHLHKHTQIYYECVFNAQ